MTETIPKLTVIPANRNWPGKSRPAAAAGRRLLPGIHRLGGADDQL